MTAFYYENKTFKNEDYAEGAITKKEFEECTFVECDFSACDLSDSQFLDCVFEHCNLSNAIVIGTGLKNVQFNQCKLIGIDFQYCNDFLLAMSFKDCSLDYTNFFQKKLPRTIFKDCKIENADFSEADLSGSSFVGCDLSFTTFEHSILEQVDFRNSRNYRIDPEQNKINKAKFSMDGIAGLLTKYDIEIS